jgi:transketolase
MKDKTRVDPVLMRRTILKMAYSANSVHIGCAFSLVDLMANDRDILALSKGHGVMACYAALFQKGIITSAEIASYFHDGSILKGLSSVHCPGIEVSGGSLGHGITVATGMALADKLKGSRTRNVFAIVGDGEINEGSAWESFLFAAHHSLRNLVVIVDANSFQAMGRSSDVLSLEPLKSKFEAFGFECREIDGHSESSIEDALHSLLSSKIQTPKAVIARTVKGKGVSFMENNNVWHYSRLDKETLEKSLIELES